MNQRLQLRFGQSVGLKELVATLVVSGVLLIVGTIVFAKVKTATANNDSPDTCYQQTNNTACFDSYNESVHENLTVSGDAGSAIANVESTTYDSFEILPRTVCQGLFWMMKISICGAYR